MNTIVLLLHLIRRKNEEGINHLKQDQDMLVIKICVLERKKEERKVDLRKFVVVSLVDVVLDGAFGGVGEEEVVVGDGVERFSLSLVRSTNSCFGGMIVSLIFLNPWEEDACVSMEV
ncbi:hypothetical protein Tco_1156507 [Tanacetum coccineum]